MTSFLLALILGVPPFGAPSTNVDGWNDIDRSAGAAAEASRDGASSEALAALYAELEAEFRVARSAWNAAKGVPSGRQEPLDLRLAYAAKIQPLADAGHGPAIAWLARRVHSEDPQKLSQLKLDLYRRILPAQAGAAWVFDDEIDLIDSLSADTKLLGASTTSAFAGAIFAAVPPHPFEHRLRALTLEASALAPLGEPDPDLRKSASDVWRRELDLDPAGPFARYCENGLWRLRHFAIGKPVPGFTGTDIDGNEIQLSDFDGKAVVISFFSFERTGDRARAVFMHRLASSFESAPFALIGIDQDPKPTLFRKLWEELELRFPCVFEGGRSGPVASGWHLDAPPRNLVIDRTGKLRFVDLDHEALERAVAELTSAPAPAGNLTATNPPR
jgi:peroxiredoxin